MSKTYVIADLHGRFDLLEAALERIAGLAAGADHTIITLGDYVDRGPQSAQIIGRLMAWSSPQARLICLRGNHESLMLLAGRGRSSPSDWLMNGGDATLLSYGHPIGARLDLTVVDSTHLDWIESLPLMHVDRHRIFVHAGVDPAKPLDEQTEAILTWVRYPKGFPVGHGDRHVVHGHDKDERGPLQYAGRTNLDTAAWQTGRLVIGVFDDAMPGGPVDLAEIQLARDPRFAEPGAD